MNKKMRIKGTQKMKNETQSGLQALPLAREHSRPVGHRASTKK